ncbi:MAG TPA: hypothetical protein RMH99_01650 [Sandaracinaceae bacterium LLY-WYZ-13_1]|nr:hypothetical protein [Sandaracinaceae bacterium LLY-WYZ-13_1]
MNLSVRRVSMALIALACVACDDTAEPPTDAGLADAARDSGPPPTNPAYMVASRLRTPSGRTFYVSVEPDLEARTVDLSRAFELNGFSRAYTHDGAVFTMDSEALEVTRHRVTGSLDLEPEASFSLAGRGIRAFRPLFVFLSSERAYYVDFDGLQVIVWNPSEMIIEGSFPLGEVDREGFTTEATDVRVVGDRVFVTLAWTNFSLLDVVPSVGLLVIDAENDAVEGLLEDDRCAAAGGAFVDENGDLYVLGDNDDGRYAAFGSRDLPPPCLLRVREGADGFDPDYYLDLSEVTGAEEVGHIAGLPDRTAVTRVVASDIDFASIEDPTELAFEEIWEWVVMDLDAPSATSLGVPPTALPFPPFEVDGELVVQREDGDEGISTLYRVEGTGALESLTVDGEFLQLDRIR